MGILRNLREIVFLPFVGWGPFGLRITPAIAAATLLLHLTYGATLGWVADREIAAEQEPRAPVGVRGSAR